MIDIIINLQKSDTENSVTTAINFISSKDVDEEGVMHSKADSIEFMSYDNVNEVINELFESLRSRCQIDLETLTRGSVFFFFLIQFN